MPPEAISQQQLDKLIAEEPEGLSDEALLDLIAELVDGGFDRRCEPALVRAWELSDRLLARPSSEAQRSRAYYCRANIWAARRYMSGDQAAWVWQSEAIAGEVLELRRSLNDPGFAGLDAFERAQLYTNLGNLLNHVGRFIEAIEMWDRAIAAIAKFAKALGNRGVGLGYYARALYDDGHASLFGLEASRGLEAACATDAVWDGLDFRSAREVFRSHLEDLTVNLDLPRIAESFDPDGHSLGRGRAEKQYRRWCLENRLFLNPLNDLGAHAIAGRDIMTLPSIVVGLEDGPGPPAVIHYFNLLKQEYCAARFSLYEGLNAGALHYSDRGVLLYNTLDYPAHGFAIERMKMAYRGAYALFDKMAFLLNVYLDLGHPERQVSFRNLWFKNRKGKELHPSLDGLANWPLRGLFWLAKDIFEDDFRNTTEPDAQELYELRNHLEHKYVSVHESFFAAVRAEENTSLVPGKFDISTSGLETRTLRLLRLARAGLTYLSLGIHAEERRRTKDRGDLLIGSMPLDEWPDDWKRAF